MPVHKGYYMNCVKPLSDLFLQYSEGGLTRMDFEGRLFRYLLLNCERYRLFAGNRDRWNEFLSWLYPRLKRAIDLYRDTGSSFDAYITGLIHNASKEYRSREADHHLTEYVCWRAKAEEMTVQECEPEYQGRDDQVLLPPDIRPRQILFLLLKSYYFVSDEYVNRIAGVVGMDSEKIRCLMDEIHMRRSRREEVINNFRIRYHSQHYRCLAYQKKLYSAQPGTEYYDKMKRRLDRAEKRYFCMSKRLKGVRMNASNKLVSEVLGIPKGTVDSGLFSMKDHLASFSD